MAESIATAVIADLEHSSAEMNAHLNQLKSKWQHIAANDKSCRTGSMIIVSDIQHIIDGSPALGAAEQSTTKGPLP